MNKYVLFLIMIPVFVFAQHPPQMGGKAMERLESYKKVKMLEALKLDEETGLRFISRYNNHRETVRGLEMKRIETIDDLESKMKGNPSDADYQKSFNTLTDLEKEIADVRAKYLVELKEILTNKQIAEYLVFERNFARDIRDIIRDVQKDRMRRR